MARILPSTLCPYSQLLKNSLRLYKGSFTKVFILSILLATVAFIPRLLSVFIGQDIFTHLEPLSLHRLWFLAIYLVDLTFFIGIIWHMHCVDIRKHEPLIEDITVGLKKLVSVVLASIVQYAIIFAIVSIITQSLYFIHQHNPLPDTNLWWVAAQMLLYAVPLVLVLYFYILFLFMMPLIAVKNMNFLRALAHSAALNWNHWWRIFSTQYTPWVCYLLLLCVIKYVLHINIRIYFTSYEQYTIWPVLLELLIFALYIPWVAALLLTQLNDLELRKMTSGS